MAASTISSYDDSHYMALALALAERGLYSTSPNPRVGCVIVREGQVIGEGFHRCAGEAHAEVGALAQAGDASGTTAYVTLEPCSHTGKTPPCCEALIAAGVARVVVAMQDPNPLVAGQGVAALIAAGIKVDIGVLEAEARALNPGFIKRMESGLPWLRVKLAMSLDGRTAMASGESQWITGADARSDVQRLRARSCAVISGVDTVISDDASLTVRADELGLEPELSQWAVEQQPLRVVLDSGLRLRPDAKILSLQGPVLIVCALDKPAAQRALEEAGAQVLCLPGDNNRVDLTRVLKELAKMACNEVLLEAGATLSGAMAIAGLVDQYTFYMAPTLLGSDARPLLTMPLYQMSEQRGA